MKGIGAALVVASLGLTACSREPQAAAPAEAREAKDKLTGDAAGTPADNPQCQLFTPAEVANYIGEAVSPGQNAALGTGCQWLAADGTGDVIIAVVPSSYHEPPSSAPGYRAVPAVGSRNLRQEQLRTRGEDQFGRLRRPRADQRLRRGERDVRFRLT